MRKGISQKVSCLTAKVPAKHMTMINSMVISEHH